MTSLQQNLRDPASGLEPPESSPKADRKKTLASRLRQRARELFAPILFFIFALIIWQVMVRQFSIQSIILPAPTDIWRAFIDGVTRGSFVSDFYVTTLETVIGLALGTIGGVIIGSLTAEIRMVERIFYPYVMAVQAIPKLAVAPILVIWLGFGISSKIALVGLMTFFPITVGTVEGLRAANESQLEMLRSFGASKWELFRKVRLWAALPYFFAGLDVAAVLSVLGAVVAEWLGSNSGLGAQILRLTYELNVPAMFAILVILSAMGVAAHMLVQLVKRRIVRWKET